MDHQAHYFSYHKSIILTMTLFFIFPPLLLNTTYLIHVVTLRLWIDDPCMNGTMTPLDPDPLFGSEPGSKNAAATPNYVTMILIKNS
jgi:hypothetical protein